MLRLHEGVIPIAYNFFLLAHIFLQDLAPPLHPPHFNFGLVLKGCGDEMRRFFHFKTANHMSVELLTKQDWLQFKSELLHDVRSILNQKEQPKKWLKTEEVKKLLKVSPGTLQNLRINGTLQYSRLGNIIYYDYDHIQKILEKNLQKAGRP
jgi:hypothetical protein